MVLYRFESRILGRNQGQSSVSYAAYLAAEKLRDERYGEVRDFGHKRHRDRVYHSEILAPENAPDWTRDRQEVWNRNEAAEKRKDAQVAREIIVSLPTELSHAEKVALGLRYVREEYAAKGMVADVNFHNFRGKGSHNPHMQVLLTTRKLEGEGFAKKKEEAWRPKFVKDPKTGRTIVDPEFLKAERQAWERHCNHALEQAGHDLRVDARSLKDQNIDRLPQPKKGKAHAMEQRGEWVGRTRAGDRWRETQSINALKADIENLRKQHVATVQQAHDVQSKLAYDMGQELAQEDYDTRRRREQEMQHRQHDEKIKPVHQDKPESATSIDDRALIKQLMDMQADRERSKSRATSQNDQAATPARDTSLEQQTIKLTEAMAAFDRHDPAFKPSQHQAASTSDLLSSKQTELAPIMNSNERRLEEQAQRITKDAMRSADTGKPVPKIGIEKRQEEMAASRLAREAVTQRNQPYKDPVAERIHQNMQAAKTYQPQRDGVNIEKEFQKEWTYQIQLKGKQSFIPKTDQEIAKKLAICGHPKEDLEKVIDKHSPYVAELKRYNNHEAAREHVKQASQYPEVLYQQEKEYDSPSTLLPRKQKTFSEMADERANERLSLGKDRHSIEDIPNLSAKREVIEKRQQEQRQREREQQAHETTRDIMR